MTPTDELWIDMAQFDTEIADGLWDGQLPADAPAWCSDVASLIGTARGPATDDELAAEDMVVSRMAEAILAAAAGDAPSDEELYLAVPPVDVTDDDLDDDELAFVRADGEGSADAPDAPDVGADDAGAGAREPVDGTEVDGMKVVGMKVVGAKVDGAKVDGAKVNGTKPALTVVPDAPVPPEGEDGEGGSSGSAGEPAEENAATVASRPLAGGRRRPAGKRSGGPRHFAPRGEGTGRLRLVRRVVAVKAVATTTAVAIGITAAAAATGVVVTVVDPPAWPGGSDDKAQSTTLLPPAMTIDLGSPAEDGRPGRGPRSSPVKQLTCVLDFWCDDPAEVVGTETAAVLAELKESDPGEFERRVVTSTTGPRPTSTTDESQPVGDSTDPEQVTTTTAPPDETPTTSTTLSEATTTTSQPEDPTTTTTTEDPTTTSTTSTTVVEPAPATLAAPAEG